MRYDETFGYDLLVMQFTAINLEVANRPHCQEYK